MDFINTTAATYNTTPIKTLPIMGMIAHSFGNNTVNKYQIISASIDDTAGTITVKTQLSFTLSVGNVIQVYGLGAPYDGVWVLTAVNQPAQPAYCFYTYVNSAAVGLTPRTYTPQVGSAYAYVRSQVGNNSGYYGAGGIAWAMILSKRAFCVPQSYVYAYSGGTIIGGGDDPGLAGNITNMLSKSILPQYVYIDLGINDCTSSTITLAQMQSVVSTNVPRLTAAGIIPIMMGVRPVQAAYSGTLTPLQVNKKSKQYNKWLSDFCRQIGVIYIDSNYLSRDVNSTNAAAGGDLSTIYADFVHVNALGAKRDGLAINNVLSKILPPNGTPVLAASDAFDATYNKVGTIAPLTSGIPAGLFSAVVAPTAVTGTAQTLAGIRISTYGAGTAIATAEVRASTATASDGSLLPGFELVLKLASGGTGPKNFYITLSNGAIAPSAATYTGGDYLQMEAEVYIPSSGVTTTCTYAMPIILIQENMASGTQFLTTFGAGRNIVSGTTQDIAFDGVLATPIITTTTGSTGVLAVLDVGVQSGTLTTDFIVIVRSITFRKVDPTYGEPF